MGCYHFVYWLQVCLLLLVSRSSSSSSSSSSSHTFLSGDVLKEQRYAGRNLLQALRQCPVGLELESANYTILTSKCKGPDYPKTECCAALGDFACPFANYINDPSYDCSAVMFTYIDQRTGYPRGLFNSECRKEIPCPGDSPTSSPADADASASAVAHGDNDNDDDALFVIVSQTLIFLFTLLFLYF